MTRQELETHLRDVYNTDPEYPWARYPEYAVFRHAANRKWFAVTMSVPREKMGLEGDGVIPILNLKTDPILLGSLLKEEGFFPAYHMSKSSWVSAALDGSADSEKIRWLLDLSYSLTAPKVRHSKGAK